MKKEFVIANSQGLHARPATTLVSKANNFKCDLTITYEGQSADLKSIMGVLSLGVTQGSLVEIIAKGEDEAEAIDAISKHIKELNVQ